MTLSKSIKSVLGGVALAALAGTVAYAADAPVPNKGDSAWMLISTALVLMMSALSRKRLWRRRFFWWS